MTANMCMMKYYISLQGFINYNNVLNPEEVYFLMTRIMSILLSLDYWVLSLKFTSKCCLLKEGQPSWYTLSALPLRSVEYMYRDEMFCGFSPIAFTFVLVD